MSNTDLYFLLEVALGGRAKEDTRSKRVLDIKRKKQAMEKETHMEKPRGAAGKDMKRSVRMRGLARRAMCKQILAYTHIAIIELQ